MGGTRIAESPEGNGEHCQIEARVVGYEDATTQKLHQLSCQFGEGRSIRTSASRIPWMADASSGMRTGG